MESQANPKTQRISGYILIILACLGFILSLIANLLEGKIITSGFITKYTLQLAVGSSKPVDK
jgi:hypothetical protein